MSTQKEQTHLSTEVQEVELTEALTIVELEERFEMTVVAADSTRCTVSEA